MASHSRGLSRGAGIFAGSDQLAGALALGAGFPEPDVGIDAYGEALLPAEVAALEVPEFGAARSDF